MYRVSAAAAVPAVGTTTGDRECVWPWALAGLPGVGRAYGLRCDGPSDLPKKELWKHKLGACVVACGSGASGASEPHSAMVCCCARTAITYTTPVLPANCRNDWTTAILLSRRVQYFLYDILRGGGGPRLHAFWVGSIPVLS